jgi:hypothetical protein
LNTCGKIDQDFERGVRRFGDISALLGVICLVVEVLK